VNFASTTRQTSALAFEAPSSLNRYGFRRKLFLI